MAVEAVLLTAEAFAPFGTVIPSPTSTSTATIPDPPPPNAVYANQGTALKYSDISPFTSTYRLSPSGLPARPTTNLFSCFPRTLRTSRNQSIFDVRILERHPFTTQSFIPISSKALTTDSKALIIVAPTLSSPEPPSALTPYFPQYNWKQDGPPDLKNLKAFIAEPGVGVAYGVGIWHAPMVIIGEERIDFVVTQWMSGRADEDCQELGIGPGCEVILNASEGANGLKAKL
ncbi:hypothetical protein ACLMJK_006159 [Lecanora helva]